MIKDLIEIARKELGVTEEVSNDVKYNTWFYGKRVNDKDAGGAKYAWCCVFVAWCFNEAQLGSIWVDGKAKSTASCQYLEAYARKVNKWVTDNYKAGDIFTIATNGVSHHTGIIISVNGTDITTIEGNTSTKQDFNGGMVKQLTRKASSLKGAFRPDYKVEQKIPEWAIKEGVIEWAVKNGFNEPEVNKEAYWLNNISKLELAAILKRILNGNTR